MIRYSINNHVSWKSEAGSFTGKVIEAHFEDLDYQGDWHRASKVDPQYEIERNNTDHFGAHKEGVLTKSE